jgi:hypothetical protein
VALGLETLEMARIHQNALTTPEFSDGKRGVIQQAEIFFTETIIPIENTHQAARQSRIDSHRLNDT